MFQKFTKYVKDAYIELKKVVWPTNEQTRNYSIVVIALSLGVAFFFGFLDYIFSFVLGLII